MSENQLCVIDGDVDCLDDILQDQYHYTSIMVHFNNITYLNPNSIHLLTSLQSLDLSANKLENGAINVLSVSSSLQSLNISSNENITTLTPLFANSTPISKSLKRLDASFNFINDNGLIGISEAESLTQLSLHGNCIENLDSVFTHISPLKSLRTLLFMKNGRDKNPVCESLGYKTLMKQEFIQLLELDEMKHGGGVGGYGDQLIENIMNAKSDGSNNDEKLSQLSARYENSNNGGGEPASVTSSFSPVKKSKIPVLRRPSKSNGHTDQKIIELQNSILSLQNDLSREKSRRIESEEANMKLDHKYKIKASEVTDLKSKFETYGSQINKLKQALFSSKNVIENITSERDTLKKEFNKRQEKIKQIGEKTSHITKITTSLEQELIAERAKVLKHKSENEELLKNIEKQHVLTDEIDHLKRKSEYQVSEHEMELKKVKSGILDDENPEFRSKCQKILLEAESRMRGRLQNLKSDNSSLEKNYQNLENEFREALIQEEARFSKVQSENIEMSEKLKIFEEENLKLKTEQKLSSERMKEKEILIRESKAKIEGLSKSGHEKNDIWKSRIDSVEKELNEQRKLASLVEPLRIEKSRLLSRITAHESVLEGLKQERVKWTDELSKKGFELANEKGRLEAKITGLEDEKDRILKEVAGLQDVVKIKAKLVEDQAVSFRDLKEKLNQKMKYEDRQTEIDGLQKEVRKLFTRKEELKFENSRLEDQLAGYQSRWQEKSAVIERLEDNVKIMKRRDQGRIEVLKNDKNTLEAKLVKIETVMGKVEERFRQQVTLLESRHNESIREEKFKFDRAIGLSNEKIIRVEEEMRTILLEQAAEKTKLEDKYKHVGEAFRLLQKGLN